MSDNNIALFVFRFLFLLIYKFFSDFVHYLFKQLQN